MCATIVLATNNLGKQQEIESVLFPLNYHCVTQDSLGITEIAEPHPTFIENCLAKARHAAQHSGLPAIADDSGLCVPALHGAPGIHSARYSGHHDRQHRDQRNNQHLIQQLLGISQRKAYYYCVMVYLRHANDPQPIISEGVWRGELIDLARGTHGFGYDPHFYLPELGKTAAELDLHEKNLYSHRALALQQLVARLQTMAPT